MSGGSDFRVLTQVRHDQVFFCGDEHQSNACNNERSVRESLHAIWQICFLRLPGTGSAQAI